MDVSVFSDCSVNVPHGAMRASPPTLKTHVVFVGADGHIGPEADGMGVSVFPDRSGDIPSGAMRASPPTLKTHVVFVGNAPNAENARCFFAGADAHIGPRLAVQACPFFLTAPETHPTRRCRHRSYEKSASVFCPEIGIFSVFAALHAFYTIDSSFHTMQRAYCFCRVNRL